jgi:predicted AlkP superfamily pyrophosphatase or phosphodiesterase
MRNAAVALSLAIGLFLVSPSPRAADKPTSIGLVVLVVVDQMRADYIDRYGHTWSAGLKRLLEDGARFSEAAYPYLNTVTCPGHATIGTGRFPARHGIILNEWWDRAAERRRACTDDPKAATLTPSGLLKDGHSGARLEAPTLAERIGEQGGRVASLALKPRSAMMMAGKRAASLVAWYDDLGTWATSNAYTPTFPAFAADYILKHPVEALRGASWTRLLPTMRYKGFDDGLYERPTNGWTANFPHVLDSEISGRGARYYRQWQRTPFADAYVADLAIASIDALNLGKSAGVDFLGISLSALDAAGHNFGPDSHEVQDVLIRLDKTLGRLLAHLDARVGRGRYTLALTADHGVAPIPDQSKKDGLDAGRLEPEKIAERVNEALVPLLGPGKHVAMMNYTDLFFARGVPEELAANPDAIKAAIDTLAAEPGVLRVFTKAALVNSPADSDQVQRAAALSHHPVNSGDLIMVPKPYWIASTDAATHGTMQPYDQRVPVILYGAGVKAGVYKSPATPADIAPTLARIVGVPFGGTDGRPLIQALTRDETAARSTHVPPD